MFAKIEQRTSPFPPDWSQAPPQRMRSACQWMPGRCVEDEIEIDPSSRVPMEAEALRP